MTETKWISVEERLPQKEQVVLVYSPLWNGYDIASCKEATDDDGGKVWENQDGDWSSIDDFSHWMPLPAPPEVET